MGTATPLLAPSMAALVTSCGSARLFGSWSGLIGVGAVGADTSAAARLLAGTGAWAAWHCVPLRRLRVKRLSSWHCAPPSPGVPCLGRGAFRLGRSFGFASVRA